MFCNRFFNSNKRFAKVAGIGYLCRLMNIRFSYLLVSLVITLGIMSCGNNGGMTFDRESGAAWILMRSGDEGESMEKFLRLADNCHRSGDFDGESISLYCAAQMFLEQRDTAGMQVILAKMGQLADAHPDMPNVNYSFHAVRQGLYAILFEDGGREADRDAMLYEGRTAISLLEQMSSSQLESYKVNPVWSYYNMAVAYDMYFDPPVRDSIAIYLDKAKEANTLKHLAPGDINLEGDISIRDEQAWLYYYDGEYEKAEVEMFEVLALIDTVEAMSPNTVLTEKGEAYAFLTELYSNTGRPEKALEYQQLKNENDLVRLGVERNEAVNKVQAQYNVAKAETKVARLRAALAVSGGMILALALATIILYLWRRNRLEQQYSQAVEALVEADPEVKNLLGEIPADKANKVFASASKALSAVERKYILLFMSGKTTEEIADAMHVAPASVYTMKYRIKKKYPEAFPLPF